MEFEAETIDYKKNLLDAFRGMVDPFSSEIVGEKFDYEPNPSDPSNPQKTVEIAKFESSWQWKSISWL